VRTSTFTCNEVNFTANLSTFNFVNFLSKAVALQVTNQQMKVSHKWIETTQSVAMKVEPRVAVWVRIEPQLQQLQ